MTLVDQCCNRRRPSDARTKSVELTTAIVPAGTSFPAIWQELSILLLSSNLLLRPVELGPVDPHAMQNDRELTSDRYLGLAEPVALGELCPKPSRPTISGRASA